MYYKTVGATQGHKRRYPPGRIAWIDDADITYNMAVYIDEETFISVNPNNFGGIFCGMPHFEPVMRGCEEEFDRL